MKRLSELSPSSRDAGIQSVFSFGIGQKRPTRPVVAVAFELLFVAAFACTAAVFILPFSLMMLLASMLVVVESFRIRWQHGQRRAAVLGAFAGTTVVCAVLLAAAFYRPAKIAEQELDREVSLDATAMSLGQLGQYCQQRHDQLPVHVSFEFDERDARQKELVVHWPSRRLTLRQFVQSIESQTPLRGHFSSCGNGWTLLYGPDCSFGLSLRDPRLSVPRH